MGRLRWFRRALCVSFLGVCALLSLTLLAGQIEQRLFRRRAEFLLAQIQSLELRKTPWHEALNQLHQWTTSSKFDQQCNEHKGSLDITLDEFVLGYVSRTTLFVRLDDYVRWKLNLSYDTGPFSRLTQAMFHAYIWMGGRPSKLVATVGMRDGIVWSKGFTVMVETYVPHVDTIFGSVWGEYTLFATAHSVPRLDSFGLGWVHPQVKLHPHYMIGRPTACEICVEGWAKFTPFADPADVHRLMQLHLSCLTRWRPCLTQNDIMPAAWAQYLAESARGDETEAQPVCSPAIIEVLGRDSANIVSAEILQNTEREDGYGYHESVTSVRVLELLKGAADWKVGETRKVSFPSRAAPRTRDFALGLQYSSSVTRVSQTNFGSISGGVARLCP